MKKPYLHETLREEAARQDALEGRGGLDELPFTELRRYAKEPSQVYAIRIPVGRLRAIRSLAERRREQPTALLREWVLERLDAELARTQPQRVGESLPPPYSAPAEPTKRRAPLRTKRGGARKPAAKTSSRRTGAIKRK